MASFKKSVFTAVALALIAARAVRQGEHANEQALMTSAETETCEPEMLEDGYVLKAKKDLEAAQAKDAENAGKRKPLQDEIAKKKTELTAAEVEFNKMEAELIAVKVKWEAAQKARDERLEELAHAEEDLAAKEKEWKGAASDAIAKAEEEVTTRKQKRQQCIQDMCTKKYDDLLKDYEAKQAKADKCSKIPINTNRCECSNIIHDARDAKCKKDPDCEVHGITKDMEGCAKSCGSKRGGGSQNHMWRCIPKGSSKEAVPEKPDRGKFKRATLHNGWQTVCK